MFRPGFGFQLEVSIIEIAPYVQFVPFFRVAFSMIDGDRYVREVSGTGAGPGATAYDGGLGVRVFPVRLERFRPYVLASIAYSALIVGSSGEAPAEGGGTVGVSNQMEAWYGPSLGLGLGLRYDIPDDSASPPHLIPLYLEAQWAQHFWGSPEGDFLLTGVPPQQTVNYLHIALGVGFML